VFLDAARLTAVLLAKAMGEACEVSDAKARQMLTFLSDTAVNEVKKNGLFVVPGLGRLVKVKRKALMGRNPATGAAIKIAAKKVVEFRIAKAKYRLLQQVSGVGVHSLRPAMSV
jgi:DNA-binding protein HU-beta